MTHSYLISNLARECLTAALDGNIASAFKLKAENYQLTKEERQELIGLLQNYASKLQAEIDTIKCQ